MRKKNKPWIREELFTLKKYYNVIPMSELLEKLPNRTESAIHSKVQYLKKRKWSFQSKYE